MNIHDLNLEPIERVEGVSASEVRRLIATARRPIIFSGIDGFEFLGDWSLDHLAKLGTVVPVQQPESDGVNHFFRYFDMPVAEFVERIKSGESLYIGAREILEAGGDPSNKDGLSGLADSLIVPDWFDIEDIWSANLWVGAGGNRTLLHYDPWDSIQMLREGKKEFIVLPDSESDKVFQIGLFNFSALYKGKVLHSKINALDVQDRYKKKFETAKGYKGTFEGGEAIFIPAGFWHYVESSGQNIGVNFFVHFQDKSLQWKEPLRTYWIKDKVMLWPVRLLYKLRFALFWTARLFFPKKKAAG